MNNITNQKNKVNYPKISVIIPTYNRASTIIRAIDSVLLQTYKNLEVIIIDDGSTDDTLEKLKIFNNDERIKVLKHEKNKGVNAAINTGFNNINGEWFTLLGSDDEIIETALEELISIPLYFDPLVSAVSCNCLDTSTNLFAGEGLENDQYLDEEKIISKCSGEHWGITKTDLLDGFRFNESLSGQEVVLWYKINEKAKRYYIHKALRIYHTEGSDRITKKNNYIEKIKIFKTLSEEKFYIDKLKLYNYPQFIRMCIKGIYFCKLGSDRTSMLLWYQNLLNGKVKMKYIFRAIIIIYLSPKFLLLKFEKIRYYFQNTFKRLILINK